MIKKNFNEVYEILIKQKNPILDGLQRKKQASGIIFIIIAIIAILFYRKAIYNLESTYLFMIIFFVLAVLDVGYFFIVSAKYKSLYKQTTISDLVKSYSDGLTYNSKSGVLDSEYRAAGFHEIYNKFYSEDLIQGIIDNQFKLRMSEVRVEKENYERDSSGNLQKRRVVVFRGLFGTIRSSKVLLPYFEVGKNSHINKFSGKRIEVDSLEFENHYDLYTDDKVRTMEVFTADVIDEFNKIREEFKQSIQMKSKNSILYFRISMPNSFEAPNITGTLDFDLMYKNFKKIDMPISLASRIVENAEILNK